MGYLVLHHCRHATLLYEYSILDPMRGCKGVNLASAPHRITAVCWVQALSSRCTCGALEELLADLPYGALSLNSREDLEEDCPG